MDESKLGPQDEFVLEMNQRLYEKYIIVNAPFQVNLPATVLRQVQKSLGIGRKQTDGTVEEDDPFDVPDVPTAFDHAQHVIMRLMETDSSPRYFRSDLFLKLSAELGAKQHSQEIMKDLGVL